MALDPVLLQMVSQIPVPSGEIDYVALREQAAQIAPLLYGQEGPIEVASVDEQSSTVDGTAIPMRIYRPTTPARGTLHFYHGGGWVGGDLAIIDPVARRLARDLSMVVVSSTYRLAPEHPFPAGFKDALAAARWTRDNAVDLGGPDLPLVIGGESAGGNFAAAVAMALRDAAEASFDAQLLFYPAVDLRPASFDNPSRITNADPGLPVESLRALYPDYYGAVDPADPRISPLAASSFDRLPPAIVAVLTVDPLRDEAVDYANRINAASGTADLIEFDNLTHGFPGFAALVPAAAEAFGVVVERLESLLAKQPA